MRSICITLFILLIFQNEIEGQLNCFNYFVPNSADQKSSDEGYGLRIMDSLNNTPVISFGEIKRRLTKTKDGLSIELFPYNPFTGKEEFMFSVRLTCKSKGYCLQLDSLMSEPNYFKDFAPTDFNSSNADSIGYFYSYRFLQTGNPEFVWKIQNALNVLDANGSFFLLLDIFQCMRFLTFKDYSQLFIGDAAYEKIYCVSLNKK